MDRFWGERERNRFERERERNRFERQKIVNRLFVKPELKVSVNSNYHSANADFHGHVNERKEGRERKEERERERRKGLL